MDLIRDLKRISFLFFILLFSFLIVPVRTGYTASGYLKVTPKESDIGFIRASDYEAGYKEKVWGNLVIARDKDNPWKVMLKTNDENMGVIGGYAKPISDFQWKARGGYATQITYVGITNYDVEAARGPVGNNLNTIYIDHRILLAWANDVPGDYYLTIVYTLTTQ